jgi:hypothetical protein
MGREDYALTNSSQLDWLRARLIPHTMELQSVTSLCQYVTQ